MDLVRCTLCQGLFYGSKEHLSCPKCAVKELDLLERARLFLDSTADPTIDDLSAQGIPLKMLQYWVRNKKLVHPNLKTNCDHCGVPITSGRLCSNCQFTLKEIGSSIKVNTPSKVFFTKGMGK